MQTIDIPQEDLDRWFESSHPDYEKRQAGNSTRANAESGATAS